MYNCGNLLHVCPLRDLNEVAQRTGASHVVSVLEGARFPDTPAGIDPRNHFKIASDRFLTETKTVTEAGRFEITRFLSFCESWPSTHPLIIHCLAGISRSTAAAYVFLCAVNAKCSEEEIAAHLRKASSFADPDRSIVALGDQVLLRGGRMSAAIAALDDGVKRCIGHPFSLPVHLSIQEKSADSSPKAA